MKQKIQKYLIYCYGLSLWVILSCSFVFAQNTKNLDNQDIWNCNKILSADNYSFIDSNWDTYAKNILPKDAIDVAVDHLKSACCNRWYLTEKKICQNVEKNIMDSPFLYDHLLDIFLRRLDAEQKWEKNEDLLYNLEPDSFGLAWRSFINDVWNSYNKVPLEDIVKNYKKYWTLSSESFQTLPLWDWEMFDKILTENKFKNINKIYGKNWKLVNKYQYSCELVTEIYYLLSRSDQNNNFSLFLKGDNYDIYDAYLNCRSLVQNRIFNESLYVKKIVSLEWINGLSEYMVKNLDKMLVQKRMSELSSKISRIKTYMSDIENSVVKIIPNCS